MVKIRLGSGIIPDDMPHDMPDGIWDNNSESIRDNTDGIRDNSGKSIRDNTDGIRDNSGKSIRDNKERNRKRNNYVRDHKATIEFVVTKEERDKLKEIASNCGLSMTELIKRSISLYIQTNLEKKDNK